MNSRVSSLQVYRDEIYSYCPSKVQVYDLSGQQLRSWDHATTNCYSMLIVVSDKVVIPSDKDRSLYVYSLVGNLLKKIPCPISTGYKTMAANSDK